MRWYILRTLLHKEMLRHLANRGGITLVVLLILASMLLSFFSTTQGVGGGGLAPGVQRCYVDYWQDGPFIKHLRDNIPDDFQNQIVFSSMHQGVGTDEMNRIVYPQNTGAIQVRFQRNQAQEGPFQVWFWYPGTDHQALAPFEAWFWREALRFNQSQACPAGVPGASIAGLPTIETERQGLKGGLDSKSALATALVFFGLFFVCVYLMPSLNSEERERGVLLAQMLSPASTAEILAARFLFYPVLAMSLGAILAATYQPSVLARPFFWMALIVAVIGAMGIGLTIASLTRTQRSASMGAMCYMMFVALILFICQHNGIPFLPYLSLEYHAPRMMHAALTDSVSWFHWGHLAVAALLAFAWTTLATVLFRRYGWQ
jgi:hypothetical protein